MDRAYFKEYYNLERRHWWFRARSEILAAQVETLVRPVQRRRPAIANVGAALGASSEMLSRYGHVTSVEYDELCCHFVRQQLDRCFVNASITHLPFGAATFDLVCAFDVIEHVDDDHAAVAEMIRICRPGGVVAVTVPAFRLLWSHHDEVNHHRRRYRLPALRALFKAPGRLIFSSYFNSLLFPPIAGMRLLTRLVPSAWIRKGSGSDFSLVESPLLDSVCYGLLRAENICLRRRWPLPFGVSAFVSWLKAG